MTKTWNSRSCPSCDQKLQVSALCCRDCGLEIRGTFTENEFSLLNEEDLHLLRIFMTSEGRIKEMEAPLGLSYPTLRQKVSDLNLKLQLFRKQINQTSETASSNLSKNTEDLSPEKKILAQLGAGEISFDEAYKKIKELKKKS